VLLFTDKVLAVVNHLESQKSIDIKQNASLTCSVIGGCNVHYQWIIKSGSLPSKVTGVNTDTLLIPDVRSSDENTYACVASGQGGSVTTVTQLTVTGKTIITLHKFVKGALVQVYQR